jgi:hypothetical protein
MTEDEHRGRHVFYQDGKWQKCHVCDYLEPIAMTYMAEGD